MKKIPEDFVAALIGKTEEEAKATIEEAGYIFRLTARDDSYFIVTCDYNINRVNIKTFGGKVTSATVG